MKEPARRRSNVLACGVIALAAFAAYRNCFSVPFVLDDPSSIVANPSLRHLWPLWAPLSPPDGGGLTVAGRPLLNLSLALNYAISGTGVWSYHLLNLVIHLLAGLTLFGIVRRTLPAAAGSPTLFALLAALLWVLHPLQTESVTYIIQRAEALMGLFYLLTLFAFIRGTQSSQPARWFALSVVAATLGMAVKEVMVTAPLIVWLYDYTFLTGSMGETWRRRRGYYAALAGTWLLLLWLVIGAGNRGGTIGLEAGVAWWEFALTQTRAIVRYVALAVWPHPLIFDYGSDFVRRLTDIVPYALLDAGLLVATGFGVWRRSAAGFLGACFFLVLAPSSSVVGGTRQMLAEHRMYLPLAAVIVLALLGIQAAAGRRGLLASLALAAALGVASARRNADYHDTLSLWSDTVAKRPGNAWAQNDLGTALLERDRAAEAAVCFTRALQLEPGYAEAHNNLGNALLRQGRWPEAIGHYEQALRIKPDYAGAHGNLASALLQAGRAPEALAHFATALRLDSGQAETENNFANALAQGGRGSESIAHYERALQLDPGYAEAYNNLGNALAEAGRAPEAIGRYAEALRLRPDYAEADYNLGNALVRQGKVSEAISCYEEALRLQPRYAAAHANLANVLLGIDRVAEAVAHYEAALRLEPAHAVFHYNLANALVRVRRFAEAATHYEEALRLRPDFPEARAALSRLRNVTPR